MLLRFPVDYCLKSRAVDGMRDPFTVNIFPFLFKSVTSGLLLIIGFLMWFLSGVGLLVLLIGLVLSGIPGKRGSDCSVS